MIYKLPAINVISITSFCLLGKCNRHTARQGREMMITSRTTVNAEIQITNRSNVASGKFSEQLANHSSSVLDCIQLQDGGEYANTNAPRNAIWLVTSTNRTASTVYRKRWPSVKVRRYKNRMDIFTNMIVMK